MKSRSPSALMVPDLISTPIAVATAFNVTPAQAAQGPFSTTKGAVVGPVYLMIPSPMMPMKMR